MLTNLRENLEQNFLNYTWLFCCRIASLDNAFSGILELEASLVNSCSKKIRKGAKG